MKEFLLKVLDKLKEKTTWLAIFAALNYIGVKVAPEHQSAIIDVAMPLIVLILLIAKDFEKKEADTKLLDTNKG